MGLGKTIELIGLILSHPKPLPLQTSKSKSKSKSTTKSKCDSKDLNEVIKSSATLIISPSSIAYQWVSEIEQLAPSLNVYFYQGIKANKLTPEEISMYDVVLTTYECLRSEVYFTREVSDRKLRHQKKYENDRSSLVLIDWWRICIDEGQLIESGTSHAAEITCKLQGRNRWAVTGTPMGKNGINDLRGLFLFLKVIFFFFSFLLNFLLFSSRNKKK